MTTTLRHGRVVSREHKGWRHQTHRINPDTGKPEEGKFVRVVNEHNITWTYDANGRLVEKLVDKGGYRPLEWRYRWDARSQLTGLETPEGERWEYKYDPFGRRISKRCTNRDKSGMDFHWNGDQLTEEIPVGTDGKPEYENAIRWIYEPGSFTPLARYEKGLLHYAVTDTVGRVQELLTEDGTIVWRGKQQLWGREEGRNKDDAPDCRLRFPGQYEDTESGLYYNRFRYYDPDTAQYISADPIGLLGGLNPYSYVQNPFSYIDPLGLSALFAFLQEVNCKKLWSKGSWDTPAESLLEHFRKHGREVGAETVEQYLNKAKVFSENLRRIKPTKVSGYTENVWRYRKNGRYIDVAVDTGEIVSFGRL
ncbi:hypothetical protein M1V49_24780 [Escherichia coli]|uniref:RHS repeat domain-containing protein n=1 Tax=Escherichia coli TaxID=562 RepID=UPI002091DADC|nr:RHS repeat-associated core domain-containing protein [Escherichia coli]MCO4961040.1 hypothetical protein [Escherichia coli]